jgi:hypothetical protein
MAVFNDRVTLIEQSVWYAENKPWSSSDMIRTAYSHCVYTVPAEWVAIFDPDEWMVLPAFPSLAAFLDSFPPNVGAIGVNWMLMGNNGHGARVDLPLPMGYTRRQPEIDHHVKSIIRPNAHSNYNVHSGILKSGWIQVDVRNNAMVGPYNHNVENHVYHDNLCDTACLFHYQTRSEQDWLRRLARGEPERSRGSTWRDLHSLNI